MSNINDFESENREMQNTNDNSGFAADSIKNNDSAPAGDLTVSANDMDAAPEMPVSSGAFPVNEHKEHADSNMETEVRETSFAATADKSTITCDNPCDTSAANNIRAQENANIPENTSGGYSAKRYGDNEHDGTAETHNRQSAGIRYNVDENSRDGNYTWQYSGTDEATEKKKKKSPVKAICITVASLLAVCVIGGAAFIIGRNMPYNNIAYDEATGNIVSAGDSENNADNAAESNNGSSDVKDSGVINKAAKNKDKNSAQQMIVIPENTDADALSKQMIAVKCKPSSVGIEVTATTRSYFGSYKSSGVGSGFILTEDGFIATNNHVIEGAEEITVMLDDGTKYDAELIGADDITDLAVIKIDADGLIPMEIGDSELMQVGDSVIAIGTPAGIEFAGTVTDGIISAINRDVEVRSTSGYKKTMTLMQTNAAINPGNSGGPLINNKGQVIGINTLKLTEQYEGIGFSIPINSAVKIFNQLIENGKVTDYESSFVTGNGAIGITNYVEVTEEESEYYGIPEGIMVIQMQTGSASQKAGLRRGDIIIAFNGEKVKTVDELNKLKSKFKAGDGVTLTVYRDEGETLDITFKLDIMN